MVLFNAIYFPTAIPNGALLLLPSSYQPRPCATESVKSSCCAATQGQKVLSDFTLPTSSITREQGWLCAWRHIKRETGKEVTVINVLQPECDINICMQCVHNGRHLCPTLINTTSNSSFTKPPNDLEEFATKQTLTLEFYWKKMNYACTWSEPWLRATPMNSM